MTTDQHLNTGAMALGALPEDEAAEYSEHLQSCATCTAELTGFLETAAILGSSAAQTPPASLRGAVMEAVSRTAQLPPLTNGADNDSGFGRHRQDGRTAAGDTGRPDTGQSSTGQSNAGQSDAGRLASVIPLRPWYRRPQALLAAAVAVLVIAGGLTFVFANRSATPPSAGECVASAGDKAVIKPTVGSGGDATLSPSCDAVAVNMPPLPAAPSGKVYQLWVIKGKAASSVAVMSTNPGGPAAVVVTKVHVGDTAVGVTLEPAPNGSPAPTTKPFWVVPLTA
jgi:anti-sigma factor RsiW